MRLHIANVQCSIQDGGAGHALRHLREYDDKFSTLGILAGIPYCLVPGTGNENFRVRQITKMLTAYLHVFILNMTRAIWGLVSGRASAQPRC